MLNVMVPVPELRTPFVTLNVFELDVWIVATPRPLQESEAAPARRTEDGLILEVVPGQ
jgi:hypothetical protein